MEVKNARFLQKMYLNKIIFIGSSIRQLKTPNNPIQTTSQEQRLEESKSQSIKPGQTNLIQNKRSTGNLIYIFKLEMCLK